MIRCDRLPPDNKLVFSDDRALLPDDFNDQIQEWLSERNPRPQIFFFPWPTKIDHNYSGEVMVVASITLNTICFQRQYWQLDSMRRIFIAAICLEKDLQILGPEIDPMTRRVIAPSPVTEVIVRQEDQPPASIQDSALKAAEVWAGLTDAERERYPRIGQVAALCDLDALL